MNKSLELLNFPNVKAKSWSSRIVEGHLINGKVRAEQCTECKSSCELLTFYGGDSNSILCGCTGQKCKHVLIHFRFDPKIDETAGVELAKEI